MKNNKIRSSLAGLLAVFVLLVTVGFVAMDMSFGWFSHNRVVEANGMSVVAKGPPNTTQALYVVEGDTQTLLGADTPHVFEGLCPADSVHLRLTVTNNESDAITLKLFFKAPSEASDGYFLKENATGTDDDEYYYFGTQLKISELSVDGQSCLNNANWNGYLLPWAEDDATGLQPNFVREKIDFTNKQDRQISTVITIPGGQTVQIDLVITFVDNGTNQNEYMNFGTDKKPASFNRTLLCEFAFVES